MAGYISEFFGYRAEDKTDIALKAAASGVCPFLGSQCIKILSRDGSVSGACTIRQRRESEGNVYRDARREEIKSRYFSREESASARTVENTGFAADFPIRVRAGSEKTGGYK